MELYKEKANLISDIVVDAPNLTPEKVVELKLIDAIVDFYRDSINILGRKVWKGQVNELNLASFTEAIKDTIAKSLNTFLFVKEHWKQSRNLNTYFLTSLRNFSSKYYWELQGVERKQILVCPGCRIDDKNIMLIQEDNYLKCSECNAQINYYTDELNKENIPAKNKKLYRQLLDLHKVFFHHSRKGYRCGDCNLFIPNSFVKDDAVICPYPGCCYFGTIADTELMGHPAKIIPRNHLHNSDLKAEGNRVDLLDTFTSDTVSADTTFEIKQQFSKEYSTLVQVIKDQVETVNRIKPNNTYIQKLAMYQAFSKLIEEDPTSMVSYLVHQKQSSDIPIQSRIFQKYVDNIQNELPFTLYGNEIISILDPVLDIFEGKSVFETKVKGDRIHNETVETHRGVRTLEESDRCFIGKLLNIIDLESGRSIKNYIKSYGFFEVELVSSEFSNNPVRVSHYRLIPHYEMKSLVYLQRIRRAIVDSVYRRLHGHKRVVGENKEQRTKNKEQIG